MTTSFLKDVAVNASTSTTEDDEKSRLQRLGRSRPHEFQSTWTEAGFLSCIAMSLLLDEYLASGFVALVPRLIVELDLSRSFATWAVSVVPLIVSSFLLAFGRLADLHGFYTVYLGGLVWVLVWSFIAAFARHRVLLVCCRAMQGFGSAAHLSAGLGMLGAIYRPGPRKNLVFSLYGAMAPLGSFVGIATGGLVSEYTHWRWYFWIGALLAGCSLVGIWTTAPRKLKVDSTDLGMDWLGCLTISTAVVLSVFSITELAYAPQGWKTPYVVVTGSIALLALGSAVYIEGWVARHPLLPFSVLKIDCVRPVLLGLLLSYGTIGIYMLYATL
jgi:MFS family permease